MKTLHPIVVALALCLLTPLSPLAGGITVQPVQFAQGQTSAIIQGVIRGDQTIDHTLRVRAGQTMRVALHTSNGANSFNVLPPGSEAALAIGDTLGNIWTGQLPVDGEYRIRVFLMRSAARRNEAATFTLSVAITSQIDAKVAGTPYHATGTVPCSVGPDPKGSSQCSFGVIRTGLGKAEVHLAQPGFDVTLHKDGLRVLRFSGEMVTSPDPGAKVTFSSHGDNWLLSIDEFYFYTIPDAVITGG